jgi:protein kinase
VHRQGFFHRDLKPDNLLWKEDILKIADFGLAREVRSRPPYTEYCGTRWYRAPEIILRSEFYNSPVDIWAAGVIMTELVTGKVLFQGTSETDQIYKIFGILGTPTQKTWADGVRLANRLGIRFPTTTPLGVASVIPNASPTALSLIAEMLRFDPTRRPSASQALQHDFFKANPVIIPTVDASADNARRRTADPGLDEILNTFPTSSSDVTQEPSPESRGSPFGAAVVMPSPIAQVQSATSSPPAGRVTGRRLFTEPPLTPFDDDLFGELS